ncbi:NAD(P)-binding protein [Xylaria digitata]|nr:NAD(P)-binding protein [Xylaria digitata]
MDRPEKDPLLVRIAQHLETLPFELIEPVLKDLTFWRALDLLSCAGQRLREAIRHHSRWGRVLGDEINELECLWTSLNQLAWTQYHRPWTQVNAYRFEPRGDMGGLMYRVEKYEFIRKSHVISTLDWELQSALFTLIGLEKYKGAWVSTPELKAVVSYLPVDSTLAEWARLDTTPKENETEDRFAENLVGQFKKNSRVLDMNKILFELKSAYFRLFQEQSVELRFLADLYERFPRFLKVANAPELPTNEAHILAGLRHDAKCRRRIPRWHFKEDHVTPERNLTLQRTPYRFRHPHPTLVPFEWCLRLFKVAVEKNISEIEERLPSNLRAHFDRARDGLDFIYCQTPGKRLERTHGNTGKDAIFVQYPFSNGVLPKPKAELDWLESFVTVAEWMTKEFPDITRLVASAQLPILRRRLLSDPVDYRLFVEHEPPRTVARRLTVDLKECRAPSLSKLPSLLALYMPPWPSPKAVAVAQFLAPHRDCNNDLLQLLYETKVSEICRLLKGAPEPIVPDDGGSTVADEIAQSNIDSFSKKAPGDLITETQEKKPQQSISERDLVTTANTLQQLLKDMPLSVTGAGSKVLAHIVAQIENSTGTQGTPDDSSWEVTVRDYVASQTRSTVQRDCYICGRQIIKPHQTIASMCIPCGNFNLAGSQLSLPPRLSLAGKVAAVTGARVNLGYHTTLRLLRCGAKVIASTRYPHDALQRYSAEKDAEEWIDRLLIVGADFRSARDAFELAREIRRIVQRWGGTLNILINNAAQTLTDSVEKERLSVRKEEKLKSSTGPSLLLPSTSYIPKVRAGNMASIEGLTTQQLATDTPKEAPMQGSSWVQSLSEIPYEDVISAHSVNAFVPLILVRELFPIMSDGSPISKSSGRARGYIVNVSSREGIFEQTVHSAQSAKNGKHVHTNMSKAALNMITETEAADAWRTARVAMNTVDPGYMSAAPELHALKGGVMPIGWEDGAGRVLWPIAVGELEKIGEDGCHAVWGRFLKHYGASRVNLQQGCR